MTTANTSTHGRTFTTYYCFTLVTDTGTFKNIFTNRTEITVIDPDPKYIA